MRKLIQLIGASLLFAPFSAFSLGLGNIEVYSAIGQPLDAEVQLFDLGSTPLAEIRATMADSDTYQQFAIPYSSFLGHMRLQVTQSSQGQP
ncbi:MAG: hypothetical protein KIT27_12090, partial [Legionellales bacterium]|nr:hypothetical protein [Legionellales bacterium]